MISIYIKSARKHLKKSKKDFAEMLGVSVSAVNAWECGQRNPSKTAMILLEKILQENK